MEFRFTLRSVGLHNAGDGFYLLANEVLNEYMEIIIRYALGCTYGISRYASLYILYIRSCFVRRDKSRSTISIILSNAAIYADDQILESLMQAIF